jgi:glucose-6-phosphate dehydrogenase assembly protein OpcA
MAKLRSVSKDVHGIPGPEIDVRAIERELAALWSASEAVEIGNTEVLPTRTSVLNLVIYAPSQELSNRATRVIESLATYHPSRVIIFSVTEDPRSFDSDIDAHVSSYCRIDSPEHVATCVEQVTIAVLPNELHAFPSIVAPLTLPGLPTFLWWMGQPPLSDPRFGQVLLAADRLILDSSEFTRPLSSLVREADFCRQQGGQCMISDLNWARLTAWRETIAQFFDIPECRWTLEYITRIVIRYGRVERRPDNPTQALLLIGWLSDRLGWRMDALERQSEESWTFTLMEPGGRSLVVTLSGQHIPPEFDGYLLTVSLAASDGVQSAHLDASRVGDLNAIRMIARTEGELRVERATDGSPPALHRLLISELEMVVRDRIFERSLQEAKRYAVWIGKQADL